MCVGRYAKMAESVSMCKVETSYFTLTDSGTSREPELI